MKEQIPQPAPLSRTLQGKTREANTASVTNVLQAYRNGIFQRQEVNDDERLLGEFEPTQQVSYGSYCDVEKNEAHHTPSAYSLGCIIMNKCMQNSSDNKLRLSKCPSDWLPSDIYNMASAIHLAPKLHKRTASYGGKNTNYVNDIVKRFIKNKTATIMEEIVKNEKNTDEEIVKEAYPGNDWKKAYEGCNRNDSKVSDKIDNYIKSIKNNEISPPMPRMRHWSSKEDSYFVRFFYELTLNGSKLKISNLVPTISRMLASSGINKSKTEIANRLRTQIYNNSNE